MLRALWNRLPGRAASRTPSSDPPATPLGATNRGVTFPRAIPPRPQAEPVGPIQAFVPERRLALPSRRPIPWRLVALIGVPVAVTLGAILAIVALQSRQPRLTEPAVQTLVAQAMASATPPPSTAARVYQQIAPSVVLISVREEVDSEEEPGVGIGSGVVIDPLGHILTSLHVVEGQSRIQVLFADGTSVAATIESELPEKDIAVLSLLGPAPFLVPAVLGSPDLLNVGDEAIVVGNPFGLRHTATAGVISGLHRDFESSETGQTLQDLIQFDTAVNPGNSGGPLLNRDGEVVGIVTALANPTDERVFIGIGFAVPIDVAAGAAGPPPF
jgi:S1-C subfamily serine protease